MSEHVYSEWATSTPTEHYVDGYFAPIPTQPRPVERFPRLSTTVPRHLSGAERGAAWAVIIGVPVAMLGCVASLAWIVAASPLMRGWTW